MNRTTNEHDARIMGYLVAAIVAMVVSTHVAVIVVETAKTLVFGC